jgi:cytochrome c peroxidase
MRSQAALLLLVLAPTALAQLPPPPVPPQNPITEPKRILGKLLFWEEQLSSDDTISCGTCHQPNAGGSDPRIARHPGNNGIFFDFDDKLASPSLLDADSADDYEPHPSFGFGMQVTGRTAPTAIMAAYAPNLFWDGRATGQFIDPQTGNVSIPAGGALESQVVGPPLSDAEMAHADRNWDQLISKLDQVTPMALATDLPVDMAAIMAPAPSYGDLFASAFGDPAITAERIAYAIATYERTLIADDTPWDRFMAGDQGAMTQGQQVGWQIFQNPQSSCGICHTPPLFTNHSFRNIGLRPVVEDDGRRGVTGNPNDRGRFKVPTLRNVGLKGTFFHNGGVLNSPVDNLRDVLEFYVPADGHVHFPDNIDPAIPPITIPPQALNPLADFLGNALTDPRVAAEVFPFDRPTLAAERRFEHLQVLPGTGAPGSSGVVPQIIAHSPATLGSQSFRLGVHDALGNAQAYLVLSSAPLGGPGIAPRRVFPVGLQAGGYGTWHWQVPADPALAGVAVFGQWFVVDPGSPGRFARSEAVRITLF